MVHAGLLPGQGGVLGEKQSVSMLLLSFAEPATEMEAAFDFLLVG